MQATTQYELQPALESARGFRQSVNRWRFGAASFDRARAVFAANHQGQAAVGQRLDGVVSGHLRPEHVDQLLGKALRQCLVAFGFRAVPKEPDGHLDDSFLVVLSAVLSGFVQMPGIAVGGFRPANVSAPPSASRGVGHAGGLDIEIGLYGGQQRLVHGEDMVTLQSKKSPLAQTCPWCLNGYHYLLIQP